MDDNNELIDDDFMDQLMAPDESDSDGYELPDDLIDNEDHSECYSGLIEHNGHYPAVDYSSVTHIENYKNIVTELRDSAKTEYNVNAHLGGADQLSIAHLAVAEGRLELVEKILEKHDVNMIDYEGESLIAVAGIYCRNPKMINLLVNHGADPSSLDNSGWPVLVQTLKSQRSLNALALIEAGADLNAQTPNGTTPLMACCWEEFVFEKVKSWDVAKVILQNDEVDLSITDRHGHTAFEHALGTQTINVIINHAGVTEEQLHTIAKYSAQEAVNNLKWNSKEIKRMSKIEDDELLGRVRDNLHKVSAEIVKLKHK